MDRRLLLASSFAFLTAAARVARAQDTSGGPRGDGRFSDSAVGADTGVRSSNLGAPTSGAPGAGAASGQGASRYGDTDSRYSADDDDRDRGRGGRYGDDDRSGDQGRRADDRRDGRYDDAPPPPRSFPDPSYRAPTYTRDELANSASNFFGVGAETVGAAIERVFHDNGRPTGYIAGTEGSAAFIGGVRYGNGLLYMKDRSPKKVYWRGPSVGFDTGGNGARVFTLCYNLQYPDMIYRRYPGVEGTAYFVGGLGVNYQRADDVTLAPIRAGVGLRLGANVGYLAYSREPHWFPF